ncbi:MAG: transcriptional repressor [Bryobacteraceae bacterium]|nr:transcriptional repressor [Bryobacteraceae bacterium]
MSTERTIIRRTVPRSAIIEAIRSASYALTPPEIHVAAKRRYPQVGIATVYRAVHALIQSGEVAEVNLPGETSTRYEIAEKPHHHHFRCQRCFRLFDLPGCVPLNSLLPSGFKMTRHDIVLYGFCPQCAN